MPGQETRVARPELHPLTMLTREELQGMDDLSGSTLYTAEVKRIPRLSLEEQQPLFDEARQGSLEARNRLVLHCLHSTLNIAARIYAQRQPKHSDFMDLVSAAQVKMLEKFDKALATEEPLSSLIRTAAFEMKMYGIYDEP